MQIHHHQSKAKYDAPPIVLAKILGAHFGPGGINSTGKEDALFVGKATSQGLRVRIKLIGMCCPGPQ